MVRNSNPRKKIQTWNLHCSLRAKLYAILFSIVTWKKSYASNETQNAHISSKLQLKKSFNVMQQILMKMRI